MATIGSPEWFHEKAKLKENRESKQPVQNDNLAYYSLV